VFCLGMIGEGGGDLYRAFMSTGDRSELPSWAVTPAMSFSRVSSDYVAAGLLDVVPTVCTCERHSDMRKGRLAPCQPAPPLGQCRDCKTDRLGQHDGVTRGERVGREYAPHSPWEIPKVDLLAVRDEEGLAGDVEWVFAGANESWLGELVKTRADDGLLGLVWTPKGRADGIVPSGRSTYGPNGRARDVGTRCSLVVRSIDGRWHRVNRELQFVNPWPRFMQTAERDQLCVRRPPPSRVLRYHVHIGSFPPICHFITISYVAMRVPLAR
jgi:hypothetical protein